VTVRLYHSDSFLRDFRGTVVAHASYGGKASVVLDQTAFYPEAGGQMADAGVLGGRRVVDVQVDDGGTIHHVIEGELPNIGETLDGAIDWQRRRVHMSLHTGQHMLSRGLLDVAQAATLSARLGESACTIDLDRDGLSERQLVEAEDLVNSVIDDDAPIRAWFPEADELASLALRREPKVESNVRIIQIGEFDLSPCGGTHCGRTAQVGPVRILGVERYKGGTRVTFAAGRRARDVLAQHHAVLAELARGMSCGAGEVPAAIDKLRQNLSETREQLRASQRRWAEQMLDRLLAEPGTRVVAAVPGADTEILRALATRITQAGRDALLAAPSEAGTGVLIARAKGSDLDAGATLKKLAQACGGRGGGKAEHAEGRLPADVDWPALVARTL
jgi:alanyl-tRNA synthetase